MDLDAPEKTIEEPEEDPPCQPAEKRSEDVKQEHRSPKISRPVVEFQEFPGRST